MACISMHMYLLEDGQHGTLTKYWTWATWQAVKTTKKHVITTVTM